MWPGTVTSTSVSTFTAAASWPPLCEPGGIKKILVSPLVLTACGPEGACGEVEASGHPCGKCGCEEGSVLTCDGAHTPTCRTWAQSLDLGFEGRPVSPDCPTWVTSCLPDFVWLKPPPGHFYMTVDSQDTEGRASFNSRRGGWLSTKGTWPPSLLT